MINESEETVLRLDEIDHKILARLTEHGRESFAMLGHYVGLSTAATKRRVDRLRQTGVIRRFTAEIEPAAVSCAYERLTPATSKKSSASFATIPASLARGLRWFSLDSELMAQMSNSRAGHAGHPCGTIRPVFA